LRKIALGFVARISSAIFCKKFEACFAFN